MSGVYHYDTDVVAYLGNLLEKCSASCLCSSLICSTGWYCIA
jgi:hypothetical protein